MKPFAITFGLLALCLGLPALASDLEKEQRWAQQIVDALLDGDAIHLNDGSHDFLAIETASANGSATHTAIILHGTGVHPNWPTVVYPVRTRLPEAGWQTLSIQMPVLANDAEHAAYAALYEEIPGRMNAAIDHARAAGAERVVLIAQSQGATMAAYYLANGGRPIEGLAAVGMGPGFADGPMDNLAHLSKLTLPLLDLYGSEDLPEVVASAERRRQIAQAVNAGYVQQRVAGADHFFDGEEDLLLDRMLEWLAAQPQ